MPRDDAEADPVSDLDPRPFVVDLYPGSIGSGEVEKRIPPHRLVLEPLLNVAVEVSVHGHETTAEVPVPPATRTRSILYLDLGAELLRGYEWFWNASSWDRGAVLIKVPRSRVDWAELFSWTEYGGIWSSRRQLAKGNPTSAINYADRVARGDFVIVSLSASNGIQEADVWSDPATCHELNSIARQHCRRFVRWVEHGKFDREIIYDRPPYKVMV